MTTQSPLSFESERQPTGPEASRKATIGLALFNLEQALQDIERNSLTYLKNSQNIPVEYPKLEHELIQESMASVVVESSANSTEVARQAVEEVFKNAN